LDLAVGGLLRSFTLGYLSVSLMMFELREWISETAYSLSIGDATDPPFTLDFFGACLLILDSMPGPTAEFFLFMYGLRLEKFDFRKALSLT
jgi:hypothetical protein